jgi:reactive intermediate/imine deaminase
MKMLSHPLFFTFALLIGSAGPAAAQVPQRLPFSEAVRVGDILYLSGQIGAAPGGTGLVPGGLPAEARQAMDNIGAVLRGRGLSFRDVFRCTVMLTDMSRWGEFNQVYVSYFDADHLPARSAIGASALALGAQTEIECVARFPVVARPVTSEALPALGPYSPAVIAGNLVFLSGVVPFNSETRAFAPSDIHSQMQQALANLDRALRAAGVTRADVVKTTLFLRNASDMAAMNEAYAAFFGSTRPARTTVPGVNWGRDDLLVEIDAIALAPGSGQRE